MKDEPRLKRLNEILVFLYEQYQYSPKALRELRMSGEALEAKVLKPTNLKGSRWVPYIFKAVKVSIASGNRQDMARSSAQHSTQCLFHQVAV